MYVFQATKIRLITLWRWDAAPVASFFLFRFFRLKGYDYFNYDAVRHESIKWEVVLA